LGILSLQDYLGTGVDANLLTSGITPAFYNRKPSEQKAANFDFAKPRVSSSFARTGSSSGTDCVRRSFKRDKERELGKLRS